MNLAALVMGMQAPRTEGLAKGPGTSPELGQDPDATLETADGHPFGSLIQMPAQAWSSGWLPVDGAVAAADPMANPTAGTTADGEDAVEVDVDVDAEQSPVRPRLAHPHLATPGSDAGRMTGEPSPPLAPGEPRPALPTPTITGLAQATGPAQDAMVAADGQPASPRADARAAAAPATADGDGSLALARAASGEASDDLPTRTLAMLDDVLNRPVRLLAPARDSAVALQGAQAAAEVALPSTPPLAPGALPAAPAREWLPGHLPLAPARTPEGNESAEQLNARLNWMASHQVARAQIRLSPPQLGSVEIDLEIRDGKVRADFAAQNPEARALLEAGLPRLREMFSSQGLQLVHSEVSSTPSQGQQADTQSRQGQQPGTGRAGSQTGGEATAEGDDATPGPRPTGQGRGLVDEFA